MMEWWKSQKPIVEGEFSRRFYPPWAMSKLEELGAVSTPLSERLTKKLAGVKWGTSSSGRNWSYVPPGIIQDAPYGKIFHPVDVYSGNLSLYNMHHEIGHVGHPVSGSLRRFLLTGEGNKKRKLGTGFVSRNPLSISANELYAILADEEYASRRSLIHLSSMGLDPTEVSPTRSGKLPNLENIQDRYLNLILDAKSSKERAMFEPLYNVSLDFEKDRLEGYRAALDRAKIRAQKVRNVGNAVQRMDNLNRSVAQSLPNVTSSLGKVAKIMRGLR